jgi:hypothetical protein
MPPKNSEGCAEGTECVTPGEGEDARRTLPELARLPRSAPHS